MAEGEGKQHRSVVHSMHLVDVHNIYGPFYRIGAKCGPTTTKTFYKTIKYSDIDIY